MNKFWISWFVLLVLGLLAALPRPVAGQFPPEAAGPSDSLFGGNEGQKTVAIQSQFAVAAGGTSGRLFITATIERGWHIYSLTQPPGGPVATAIQVSPPPGIRVVGPFQPSVAPEKKQEAVFDNLTVESHQGTVTWYAPIEVPPNVDLTSLRISGQVTVQPCDANSCLPPTRIGFVAALGPGIVLPGEATADAVARPQASDASTLLVQLGFAFLGGLILNLMPCVLPVISLKVLSFMQQAGESRGRVFALNVWYAAGLLSVFMVLAALAASAGLAWGEQFTLPWFKVAMTGFVFVMALSFLGVWEIPIPGFVGAGRANELQAQEGPSGAFFKGVFTTILATPCSGPFLGPVFGYLLKQPPHMAYWIFGAVGLGMASPYLVIGMFPRLIRHLPRPGAWMETVKQIMGFFLLATVVYLFSTLSAPYFVPTLAFLVGLWFACWWIGRTPLTAAASWRITAWVGGTLTAALVGFLAFTLLFQPSKIPWQPFSPEALQAAQAEGKTVMVDFSADWCLTCKTNLKFAIETNAVRDLIKANGVVPMLADWTDHSPMIKRALNELGYNSIPVLAIWPAKGSGKNVMVLSDLLRESQVLEALKEAGPSSPR